MTDYGDSVQQFQDGLSYSKARMIEALESTLAERPAPIPKKKDASTINKESVDLIVGISPLKSVYSTNDRLLLSLGP